MYKFGLKIELFREAPGFFPGASGSIQQGAEVWQGEMRRLSGVAVHTAQHVVYAEIGHQHREESCHHVEVEE